MAKTNIAKKYEAFTHEGAAAFPHLTAMQALRRSVLSCLLWENEFYEDGESIVERITQLARACEPEEVAALAIEARSKYNLRHAPLWLLIALAETGRGKPHLVSNAVYAVINRADELGELVSLYYKANGGRKPLPNQFKKGLAKAFGKFDAYQLAKYNRDGEVRLRDVAFLSHVKPSPNPSGIILAKLCNKSYYPEATKASKFPVKANYALTDYEPLATPDTWEVSLSAGEDKKATFERLLAEGKLGYLALLRNLRNMQQAGVNEALIKTALLARKGANRVLPFRFVAAAKTVPQYEAWIDEAMLATLAEAPKLTGKTVVIIDVSGSMYHSQLSAKSDMTRVHAACALGAFAREMCETASIYATAGNDGTRIHKTELVPARRGMALVDAIYAMTRPLGGGGIFLTQVMSYVKEREKNVDRVIVITDEQDCDISATGAPAKAELFAKQHYMINVASYGVGIGYGRWTHIDGFSENVFTFIRESENCQTQ